MLEGERTQFAQGVFQDVVNNQNEISLKALPLFCIKNRLSDALAFHE